MRILKRLTDILLYDGQRSSPNRQTGYYPNEECMGLKLDMLTLYVYRSRVRSKCQTREVDGTMGFLTEHAWILQYIPELGVIGGDGLEVKR